MRNAVSEARAAACSKAGSGESGNSEAGEALAIECPLGDCEIVRHPLPLTQTMVGAVDTSDG